MNALEWSYGKEELGMVEFNGVWRRPRQSDEASWGWGRASAATGCLRRSEEGGGGVQNSLEKEIGRRQCTTGLGEEGLDGGDS